MSRRITWTNSALVLFTATSMLLAIMSATLLLVNHPPNPLLERRRFIHYSYIGEDYPERTLHHSEPVEMTFEETVHYTPGTLEGKVELLALSPVWTHKGYVRLGPEQRVFLPAMFHQLHCILDITAAFQYPNMSDAYSVWHHHHCFTYLRRLFLCAADSTLEPYDFFERNYEKRPVGVMRQCRDWSALYRFADENWEEWIKSQDEESAEQS